MEGNHGLNEENETENWKCLSSLVGPCLIAHANNEIQYFRFQNWRAISYALRIRDIYSTWKACPWNFLDVTLLINLPKAKRVSHFWGKPSTQKMSFIHYGDTLKRPQGFCEKVRGQFSPKSWRKTVKLYLDKCRDYNTFIRRFTCEMLLFLLYYFELNSESCYLHVGEKKGLRRPRLLAVSLTLIIVSQNLFVTGKNCALIRPFPVLAFRVK